MSLAEQYSTTNVVNTVSQYLAGKLLTAGYLLYWHHRDTVQTSDGYYYEYSTERPTYLADGDFQSAYGAAKGLVTLTDHVPANPQHIVRPTTDGSVGPPEQVTVPVLSVEIGDAFTLRNAELGTTLKLRSRHLVIDGYARAPEEAAVLADLLVLAFAHDGDIAIVDHAAGTQAAIGPVAIRRPRVDRQNWLDETDVERFEVLLNASLEYFA